MWKLVYIHWVSVLKDRRTHHCHWVNCWRTHSGITMSSLLSVSLAPNHNIHKHSPVSPSCDGSLINPVEKLSWVNNGAFHWLFHTPPLIWDHSIRRFHNACDAWWFWRKKSLSMLSLCFISRSQSMEMSQYIFSYHSPDLPVRLLTTFLQQLYYFLLLTLLYIFKRKPEMDKTTVDRIHWPFPDVFGR